MDDGGLSPRYPHGRHALGGSPELYESERSGLGFDGVNQALSNELTLIYFDLIHDKWHLLFHRPTFIADQQKGQIPMVLIYGIMALAAR